MFFNQYPYMNLNDFNLDYVLKTLKSLSEQLENFISLNTIKYANPIQWNITKQYETNTVVIDPNDGTAYLSVKPVPTGVAITNTDYWTPIFTLNLIAFNKNITLRDDGANPLATFTSGIDDWLIWNGILYRVTRPIAVNESYLVGYNLERFTIEMFIEKYINDVLTLIGDLNDLSTADKTSVVNAINEISNLIGDISDAYIDNRIINVLYHGIANDGVTDIADDLEALINNAPECSIIFFPPGKYYFDRGITISNKVSLMGCTYHYVNVPRLHECATRFIGKAIANTSLITFSAGAYNHAIYNIEFYSDSLTLQENSEPPAGTPQLHFEFPATTSNYSCITDNTDQVACRYENLYIHGYSGHAFEIAGGYAQILDSYIYTCGMGIIAKKDMLISNTNIEYCDYGMDLRGGITVSNCRIEEIGKTAIKTTGSCKYSNVTIDQVGYCGIELTQWAFGINFSGKITRCGQYYFALTYAQFLAIPDADRIDSAYSLIYATGAGNKSNIFILGEDNGYEAWDDIGVNKKPIYVMRGKSGVIVNNSIIIIPHTTLFADLPADSGKITWVCGTSVFRTNGNDVIDKNGGLIESGQSVTIPTRGFSGVYFLFTRYSGSACMYFVNLNAAGTAVFCTPLGTEVSTMAVTTNGTNITITNSGSGSGYFGYEMLTPDRMY